MEIVLVRNWWAVALRGVLAILFGVLAFFWPFIFLDVVVYLFAAYVLIDGAVALFAAMTGRGQAGPRWLLLLEGLVGVAFGVLTLAWPVATVISEFVLVGLVAYWLLFTGVLQVIAGIGLWQYLTGAWSMVLSGILSVMLGLTLAVMMVLTPAMGLVLVAWWIGAYSVVFGVLLLVLAFELRSLVRHISRQEPVMAP
jgi:uncharacterized membrane protein HdeD (DUF308 family)